MMRPILSADLFCGAGGTTTGLLWAAEDMRRTIKHLGVNHSKIAIATLLTNYPTVRHLCESLDNVDPRKAVPGGRLDILCASPECTHHSNARGGKPRSDQSRATAWHICRWAEALHINSILVENVREFQSWGPLCKRGRAIKRLKGKTFSAFLEALRSLGYEVDFRVINCADYGDPTTRQRLFILARRDGKPRWPEPSHAGRWVPARDIIDWSIKGQSIFDRKRSLSHNTLRRIEAGLKKFGGEAFLMHTTHGAGPRVSSMNKSLPTVTCARRGEMALVEPFLIHLRGTQRRQIECSAKSLGEPAPALTTSGAHLALCEPFILGQQSGAVARGVSQPLPTISTDGAIALIEPFLLKYYGKGDNARSVIEPLPGITTKDRFALVEPQRSAREFDIRFRMLQPHELAAAMSFPKGYRFQGNREEQVKQIGNAVPVRTAAALCRELLHGAA